MTGLTTPIIAGDLHLDSPLPDLNPDGRYHGARLLVRLHGRPLGEVTLPLHQQPLPAARLAAQVWALMSGQVGRHCAGDGIAPPRGLTPAGLPPAASPACAVTWQAANAPRITVVIATRDRTSSLLRCLASVDRLAYPSFDVVVTDSAPRTDTTARALTSGPRWSFPLRYVRASQPGLALAHNTALPAVTGEIVAITDDDVEVDPGWLAAIAGGFAEPQVSCVTGLILPAELETRAQVLVEEAGGYARGFTRRSFTAGMADAGPLFPFTAGRFGSGANMAFRTSWLASRGGFDAATGAGTPAKGGDDLIAFLQVITDGGTLVYEPAAILRHWHRRDYEGMRRQAYGYGVGLGAYLTASVRARPALLGAMVRRAVPAVRHLVNPDSARNSHRGDSFPRELIWRERAGLLTGPVAYAVSRHRYHARGSAGAAA